MRLAKHFITFSQPFSNKFDKFNNTGIRMLYSIYYMTLKLHFNFEIAFLCEKMLGFCHLCSQHCYGYHCIVLLNMWFASG